MRAALLVVALVSAVSGRPADGQIQPPADARLVAFLTEPLVPEIGEVYDLTVTVRVAPDIVAFMPDTLIPSDVSFSAGSGEWTITAAPGDSLDVRATYPVMSFLPGGVYVPLIEVLTRPPAGGESPGVRRASEAGQGVERILIPTGAIRIATHSELSLADDEGRVPRPPADVLGGQWSIWLLSAMAAIGVTLAGLAWLLADRWRKANAPPVAEPVPARLVALRELERIRDEGWHTDGRLVDFYDASTGVLRRFSGSEGPEWGTALTSSELIARLRGRWGSEPVEGLRSTVWVAERVKFGSYRPDADDAERDWSTIRDWIEGMPED